MSRAPSPSPPAPGAAGSSSRRPPAPLLSRWWVRSLTTLLYAWALWVILHKGWDRRAQWRTELVDKGIGGDGIQYWQMAVSMERDHMISLDGKQPTWMRLPGYPALLRYTTRPAESDEGSKDPDAIGHRIDAWLKRAVRVNLTVDLGCALAAALLGFALGGGPVALAAAAIWAWQPWSSVVAIHTLSDPLATLLTTLCLAALATAVRLGGGGRDQGPEPSRWPWRRGLSLLVLLVGGALAALAQYVRADSILLVPALALAGYLSTDRSARARLGRALLVVVVWAVVFAPWPLRNYRMFGALHPLGSSGIDAKGNPVDRDAAFEWMRTWCVGREPETLNVAWRLPSQTVRWTDVPHTAFDNADELGTMRRFLLDYNMNAGKLDENLTARLRAMAAHRRASDPRRYWIDLPLERIKVRLKPPRDGYGLGTLPIIKEQRERLERLDERLMYAGLFGLALLALRPSRRALALVVGLWLAGRLVLIGWIPAPEPRYILEALPLIVAAAITLPDSGTSALLWLWDRIANAIQRPTSRGPAA